MIRVLLLKLSPAQQGAVKINDEFVVGGWLQSFSYIDSVTEEHVIAFQNGYVIESNSCESVEAFEI